MLRLPALFCFDMDGTITDIASSWEHLSRYLGIWDDQAEHHLHAFIKGEIDYMEFCRLDALVLKGIDSSSVREAISTISIDNGIVELSSFLKGNGVRTALISSGLSIMADRILEVADFDFVFVNELEERDGLMTGGVKVNVSIDDEKLTKRSIIKSLYAQLSLNRDQVAAIGDNWGDHGMIEEAGMRFFVKRIPAETDKAKNAFPDIVVVGSLDELRLYLADLA